MISLYEDGIPDGNSPSLDINPHPISYGISKKTIISHSHNLCPLVKITFWAGDWLIPLSKPIPFHMKTTQTPMDPISRPKEFQDRSEVVTWDGKICMQTTEIFMGCHGNNYGNYGWSYIYGWWLSHQPLGKMMK